MKPTNLLQGEIQMLFGTSGIRDLYGVRITPELAIGTANAFAKEGEQIAIATDLRETSEILKASAISGVLAKGADVVELGEVPTPTLAFYTKLNECKGIMITASHNPPEYNGLKFYRNGSEISKNEEKKIETNYENGLELCKWDKAGKQIFYANAIQDHIEMIKKNVNADEIKNKRIKCVLDTNGVGTKIAPFLLKKLGCELIEINKIEKGFKRNSEPNNENLVKLKNTVKECNAQIGVAYDGDADRAIFIDEQGCMIGLDVQLAIAIEYELACGKNCTTTLDICNAPVVVSTVEASLLIKETIEKNGGKNLIVGVGSTNISEYMAKTENAIFGGEPSGEYIYKNGVNTPDGILATAKFLEIIAKKGNLSKLKAKYKTYPILREKFKCIDKERSMEKIANCLSLGGKKNTIDGIREDFEDGFVLVRPSGTEPVIRLTAEFKNEKRLNEMSNLVKEVIKACIL